MKEESPPLFSLAQAESLAHLLADGCTNYSVQSLRIDFHGGEPLLMRKSAFESICEIFRDKIPNRVKLEFTLQTNGVLISDDWISVFAREDVAVGVSLDGTRLNNDKHRLDHKGRSTYDAAVAGLNKLILAHAEGVLPRPPAILSVINPNGNGKETYRHFVDDLGVKSFDLLLPDTNYKDPATEPERTAQFIAEAFNEWLLDDDPSIYVRLFSAQTRALLGGSPYFVGYGGVVADTLVFTVGTDGFVRVDDTLRPTGHSIFSKIGHVN